jgi:hypothetical protein
MCSEQIKLEPYSGRCSYTQCTVLQHHVHLPTARGTERHSYRHCAVLCHAVVCSAAPPMLCSVGFPRYHSALCHAVRCAMLCAVPCCALLTFANWMSLLLGSREVVSSTLGSASPACAYSSSMWLRGTAVLSSSSSISLRSCCSSLRNSVGMGLPSGGRVGGGCVCVEGGGEGESRRGEGGVGVVD